MSVLPPVRGLTTCSSDARSHVNQRTTRERPAHAAAVDTQQQPPPPAVQEKTRAALAQATASALSKPPSVASAATAARRQTERVITLVPAELPGQDELLSCRVTRPSSGSMGFTVVGGYPEGVVVGHVDETGACAGVLEAGDRIVLVNDVATHALSHQMVVELLQRDAMATVGSSRSSSEVVFCVIRGPPNPTDQLVPAYSEGE